MHHSNVNYYQIDFDAPVYLFFFAHLIDGYSMADITYRWMREDAVGIDTGLTLPQFSIAGKKQSARHVALSTGKLAFLSCTSVTF